MVRRVEGWNQGEPILLPISPIVYPNYSFLISYIGAEMLAKWPFDAVQFAKKLLTHIQPRCTFRIAIRRGRLHSAIVRFSALSTSTSVPGIVQPECVCKGLVSRWKSPGAKSAGAVTSILYRATCLFASDAGLGRKFFELDARFVRLKGRTGCLGQLLDKYIYPIPVPRCQVAPYGQLWKEIHFMRSDLVFGALSHVSNRYQLCQLASKATRKLHKPNSRLQDTTNEVLTRFRSTNPGTPLPAPVPAARPMETRRAA
jgi:hypothetical protein